MNKKLVFKGNVEYYITCDSIEQANEYMKNIVDGAMKGAHSNCESICSGLIEFTNECLLLTELEA